MTALNHADNDVDIGEDLHVAGDKTQSVDRGRRGLVVTGRCSILADQAGQDRGAVRAGRPDIYARILGQELTEALKQQFVIENKAGAGGTIGADIVAKAAPDGYTLLMMSNTLTTNETLLANKPYALMRDLVAVAPVNSSDLVMVISPSVQAKTLSELIALAKAQPGKLAYASAGPGTPYHLAGELFKTMTGTDILHVPHKNSGEARNDVMGGHVQIMFDAVTAMKGNIDAGQVRALGTTGDKRSTVLPDVPTVSEAVPGYETTIWLGIMTPKGTPPEIVERLNAEITKIMAKPQIREAWAKQGAVPMTMTPAQFDAFLRRDIDKWAKVIQQAGIKVQ
jgi:tripartite-type tricarboxylate transporter receptor subunit TctC